jgi:Protein of unknown function (DUF3999)
MRIPRAIRAAAVVAAASAAMAQLPVAWKNWQYSAPIDAGATDAARYVSIVLPVGVMTHAARGLGDLRVIDDHGKEVPYALSARLGGRASDRRPATLLEPSVVAGQYSQAMFDLGKGARVHNVITIEIEGQDELMTWVEVAVSDDHEHWRVVRERAPIYRLAQPSEAHTTIEYPESVSRYLRVRILDGSRAYHLTGASLTHEVVTEAERVPAGVTLAAQPAAGTTSVWTADAPPLPISEARFETDQKAFYRPVSVETSDDGEHWTYAGSGEIYRTVEAGQPRESLSVQFAERVSGHWRVTVHNRNDAPLAGATVQLWTTPRRVIVRQEPGQTYRLIYGNSRIGAPQYDLVRLIDPGSIASASAASLGPEEANSGYANPAPWTEQHQSVMWIALGLAVLVLGGLAIRSLRTAT